MHQQFSQIEHEQWPHKEQKASLVIKEDISKRTPAKMHHKNIYMIVTWFKNNTFRQFSNYNDSIKVSQGLKQSNQHLKNATRTLPSIKWKQNIKNR